MPISFINFEGKTEEEALLKASEELGVDKESIRYSVSEKKKKMFSEKVTITVEAKKPLDDFFDDIYKLAEDFFNRYFDFLGINGKVLYPVLKNNYALISIETDNDQLFVIEHAALLKSIQILINSIGRKVLNFDTRIVLDCAEYRLKRSNFLRDIALQKAKEVKKTKRTFIFKPLEPFERKIIHMTLQDDNEIYTESEGDSKIKRLKIIPKK